MDGSPNRRNKAAFSNFSGVIWTGLKTRANNETCVTSRVDDVFVLKHKAEKYT